MSADVHHDSRYFTFRIELIEIVNSKWILVENIFFPIWNIMGDLLTMDIFANISVGVWNHWLETQPFNPLTSFLFFVFFKLEWYDSDSVGKKKKKL